MKIKITKGEWKVYIWTFIISSILLLLALVVDNLLWVNMSPEWTTNFTVSNAIGSWTGAIETSGFFYKLSYYFGYRILGVLINWRDILAGVIFGFVVFLIVAVSNEVFRKRLFARWLER